MQLMTPTTVTLKHVNMRNEKHGEDDVDAHDLDFALEGPNFDVLRLLDASLCEAIYYRSKATEDEPEVEGAERILPNLKFPKLGALPWVDKLEGADLLIEYGTGRQASNISLPGGKSQTKKVEAKEGGTTVLTFQFSTSNMPDGVLDKLRKKLNQEVTITLVQSETAREEARKQGDLLDVGGDVSSEPAAPPAAAPVPQRKPGAPERAALAKAGKGGPKAPHKEAPKKKAAPAVPKSKQPAVTTPISTRSARGKTQTKRALAEGQRAAAATDAFTKAHGKGKKS